jgi:hypothetical protein
MEKKSKNLFKRFFRIKDKNEITDEKKKAMVSFFVLLYPTMMIVVMMALLPRDIITCFLSVAIFFYQSVLLKNFIDSYML